MTPERIIKAGFASSKLSEREKNKLECMQIYPSNWYAEPGYSSDKPIVVGNFNPDSFDKPGDFGRCCDLLEHYCAVEWEDEWTTCSNCGKLVRTSPDSYSWTQSFVIFHDCEIVCLDCLDPEVCIDEMMNNFRKALPPEIDPTDYGWEQFNGVFENGFYPGQNDIPEEIIKRLPKDVDYVFGLDSVGQFDMRFNLYIRRNGNK